MKPLAIAAGTALISFGAAAGPLLDAVKLRDGTTVRVLLQQTADANEVDADGTGALHWAVHENDVELARLLLHAGANAAAANRYGVTPLDLASENGAAAMVQMLLEHGADPSSVTEGESALLTAARTGDVATLRVLLAHGADVNAAERWKGQTALMWAAHENNAAAVALLLEAGAERDARSTAGDFTALLFAVRAGAIDAVRALLDAGADVNETTLLDGTAPLVLAVTNAHYELAALLLDRGADPNADAQGWTALHQIAWSRRWNAGFNLPGPVATGDLDSLELVRKLAAHGASIDARQKKEPIDGNRNKLNRIGATPFLLAAKSCDVPLMRVLLELGADPSITTDDGTTALMAAAGVGIWAPGENPGTHEEGLAAVKLALEAGGGNVDDVDANGETALHGAVYRGGAIHIIQFLADRGAKLDAVNAKGWTPVTVADGLEYTPAVLKRYPEAAALLRKLLDERGLPVPPSTQPRHAGDAAQR